MESTPEFESDVHDAHASRAVKSGLDVLDLTRLDDLHFEGHSLPMPGGRVFGGQVLAQAVMAADATTPDSRNIHSLHCYFLRPGDATEAIRFEVEVLRDGGSFSARRVHAFQAERPLLTMAASFQEEQNGLDHSVAMPDVPGPSEVTSGVEALTPYAGHPSADFWLERAPFDVRHVEGPIFAAPDLRPRASQMTWMRTRTPLGDVPGSVHRALIAFGCDQVLLEPLLRRHGFAWSTPGLTYASLDHAMWFHRPVRADEWLLFMQDAPSSHGGRGITGAWVFTETGEMVASMAQEGMLRAPTPQSSTQQ